MFEVVCFDLDNTLFNHSSAEYKAYESVHQYLRTVHNIIGIDFVRAKSNVKRRVDTYNRLLYFKEALKQYPHADILAMGCNQEYWTAFYDHVDKPYEGVVELIKFFKSWGCKIKVITNFTHEHQLQKMQRLNLIQLIDDVVSSEEAGCKKPSPYIFEYALKGHNLNKCCMIGDDLVADAVGSKDSGMMCFHFDPRAPFTHSFTTFKSYRELIQLMQEFKAKLDVFIQLCHRVGERQDLTQGAGGNVSVKWNEWMIIKASGCCLADVSTTSGWSLLQYANPYEKYRLEYGDKPSIETCVHQVMDKSVVVHCHPTNVLLQMLSTPVVGIDKVEYIPPGQELAIKLEPFKHNECVYLQNHGIIVSTDSLKVEDSLNLLDKHTKARTEYKAANTLAIKGITMLATGVSTEQVKLILDCYTGFNHFFTPDTAVFLQQFFTSIEDAVASGLDRFVLVLPEGVYLHAPGLKQVQVMQELFTQHCELLLKLKGDTSNALSLGEVDKLQNRPDEKFRLQK